MKQLIVVRMSFLLSSIAWAKVSSSNDGSSSAARELSGSALGRSASQRSTLSCSSTSSAAHAEQEFMLMLTHGPDAMRNLVPELAMEPDMRAMRTSLRISVSGWMLLCFRRLTSFFSFPPSPP